MPNTASNLVNGDVIEAAVVIIPESNTAAAAAAPAGGATPALVSSREAIENVNQETVLVIDSDDGESVTKEKGLGVIKESEERNNIKSKMLEMKGVSPLINVKQKGGKGFVEDWNGERVCRICHLASDQSSDDKTGTSVSELIQLGCDCKDELGIAHSHCAEAWFKLKGNRMCEICGETAKNIEGIGDNRFMEEWNEGRSGDSGINTSNGGGGGCWRGQPFCNFLMACLVIAFVLPWFFRINIF